MSGSLTVRCRHIGFGKVRVTVRDAHGQGFRFEARLAGDVEALCAEIREMQDLEASRACMDSRGHRPRSLLPANESADAAT